MNLPSTILLAQWLPAFKRTSLGQAAILAFLGSLVLTLSAKIQVPLYPVKISMQSFTVILLGCLYGARLGSATVALYLLEGALGLPVFQGTPDRGLGLPYMVGPTGGYLVGFLAACFTVGYLSEKGWGRSFKTSFFLFLIGALLIDFFGVTWLAYLMGFSVAKATYLSYQYAFLLKTALGTALLPSLWLWKNKRSL